MHTIGQAAALTGVPSATLRAWERRYAVVAPVRSPAGYRLYDDQALQVLIAMASLVAAGWSPSQAAQHLAGGAPRSQDPGPEALDGHPQVTLPGHGDSASGGADIGALARGAVARDPRVVEQALDDAFAVGSFEHVVDGWLMPALRVLGAEWSAGRVDVAGEHVVSATVHRRLGAAMEAAGHAVGVPRVAVGTARGARHELGALAFSVVLRRAGLDVVYLGADLPPEHWVAAVRRHWPHAVVLTASMAADVVATRETVSALRATDPALPVYVGGAAQAEVAHGTIALGHSLREAAAVVVDTVARRGSGSGGPGRMADDGS